MQAVRGSIRIRKLMAVYQSINKPLCREHQFTPTGVLQCFHNPKRIQCSAATVFVLFVYFSKVDAGVGHSSAHFDDLIFKNPFPNASPFAPVRIYLLHDSHLMVLGG